MTLFETLGPRLRPASVVGKHMTLPGELVLSKFSCWEMAAGSLSRSLCYVFFTFDNFNLSSFCVINGDFEHSSFSKFCECFMGVVGPVCVLGDPQQHTREHMANRILFILLALTGIICLHCRS